ncbi:phosphopyruvate hydratase [Candidatus Woesebacteria bacterium GWA1_41_8]|uniref:Enolase n=1 Tax=Candidatus Woesebacteria bacterium GWA1_41_8 TaxID=1802471 RepID=A0A1F7WGE5_9BACT|nr:MAG: phosphopyruvate hydratase [Candidatus Woesebacteria bacterium GWA1_41_8]
MATISKIWAREILDSRGIPTVETACQLDTGAVSVSSVPTGASTGKHEALELRDGDQKRFNGKGVIKAVENVNAILGPAVWGKDPTRQEEVDETLIALDGTENKSKYGANAILSVSEVVAKAGALASNLPLYRWINQLAKAHQIDAKLKIPIPEFNMINGGLHGAGNLDFQEFHVMPASSKTFSEGLRNCSEIYMAIGENLKRRGAIHSIGDEGGYAPNLFTNADAIELIVDSIRETEYQVGRDVFLGLDVAANTFYKNGEYVIRDKSSPMSEDAMIEFFKTLNNQYKLAAIEDPLDENAWAGWQKLYGIIGDTVIVVGDDLLVTNPKRLAKAIQEKTCNAILVKPNQIGTVTETIKVIKQARDAGWRVVPSHRSGETNDWFIADFAVGVGADYAKFGAPARGERVAKYNRLLSIEKELNLVSH